MYRLSVMAAGIAMAFSIPAQAEDYRWELGANYVSGDFDTELEEGGQAVEVDADIDVAGISGSWFFAPVHTGHGPLTEAAYLGRASSVDISVTDGELDFGVDDVDVSSFGIGTRWVIDKESGWLIDAAYENSEIDNEETDSFTIGGGKYILEETLLTFAYTRADPDEGDDVDIYAAELEHHLELPFGSLKLEAEYVHEDKSDHKDIDEYVGAIIYYPNNMLGFGARWERVDEGDTADNWSIFARWFITQTIAVSAAYEDFETTSEFEHADGDALRINALIRF